jgi:hypothetical protein
MLELVRYRDKRTQSGNGMLWYRTKIQDSGMPMPAASVLDTASIPMASYDSILIFDKAKRWCIA